MPAVRIGQGYDVHPFSDDPARPLVIGGVEFPEGPGLAGHSDGDVLAHAVTDALLGAAGLGDIGQHFPDDDPQWAGADSIALLSRAVADVRAAGWEPQNVDSTVILEAPKLAPRRAAMQDRLSTTVGAPVTVKGKRAEGLGALGRREGIACFAIALVARTTGRADRPVRRSPGVRDLAAEHRPTSEASGQQPFVGPGRGDLSAEPLRDSDRQEGPS